MCVLSCVQGITSTAAAALVHQAVRPLEERLAGVQQQQVEHAASSGEALGQLTHMVGEMEDAHNSLQGAVASFHQASHQLSSLLIMPSLRKRDGST